MSEFDPHPQETQRDLQPAVPPRLIRDLKAAFAGHVRVPPRLDEAILNHARARMMKWRRWSLALRWGGGAAAAAALLLVVLRIAHQPGKSAPRQVAAVYDPMDLDHDGRVDILDAFYLARQIKSHPQTGAPLLKAWDINGDGVIDQKDVDLIAGRAVRLSAPAGRGAAMKFATNRYVAVLLAALSLLPCVSLIVRAQESRPRGADTIVSPRIRFVWVDVFIETGNQPLGAYQFEFTDESRQALVAGIEGGEPAAFKSPPYYDPVAMQQNRVILAAYSTDAVLPSGRTRIARIHLQITGNLPTQYAARLESAANADGKPIPATITLMEGAAP